VKIEADSAVSGDKKVCKKVGNSRLGGELGVVDASGRLSTGVDGGGIMGSELSAGRESPGTPVGGLKNPSSSLS
jgi:hypothetical protein